MTVHATTLTREAQAARLCVLLTTRRWEGARPVIGRTLNRRHTRVSELRPDRQVRAAEPVTLRAEDLLPLIRRRHRVRVRTRGQ